jgi:hypothetical protein
MEGPLRGHGAVRSAFGSGVRAEVQGDVGGLNEVTDGNRVAAAEHLIRPVLGWGAALLAVAGHRR